MMYTKKAVFVVLLLLLVVLRGYSQGANTISTLKNSLSLYGQAHRSPFIFVHFDKTVYANKESVWLTGYLFGDDYAQHKVLSVTLVKDEDKSIWMEDRFIINHGMAFGNTFIPDTVGPGNYTFMVTTNHIKDGKPEVVFTQPITIKTLDEQSFQASLNPIDTSIRSAQRKVLLLVSFHNANPRDIPKAVELSYYLGRNDNPILQGKAETQSGQYVINIPSDMISQGNNLLHAELKYKQETKYLSMALPAREKPASVNFYPEGGNMATGIPSVIGLEVKTGLGVPLGTTAFLYENNKVIDTIQTNTYGMGRFNLTPKTNSSYSIRLYNSTRKTDTTYKLPHAIGVGPAMSINNAVVNDTLTVTINDNKKERLYLTGHNYKQLFFSQAVNMAIPARKLKLVIANIPKGLTQLTLTDSLGRPFAERTFFAHYDQRTTTAIETDKKEYKTKEKVNVKIRLNTNLPDSGIVSVACIQENRLAINKRQDIESYFYLKHDLGEIPVRDSYFNGTESDKDFLELLLLIKSWSRYKWTDVLKAQPDDTIAKYDDLVFSGRATKFNHEIKKPVEVINMMNPLNVIKTTADGKFALNDTDLLTEPNKRINLMVNNDPNNAYNIQVFIPYITLDKSTAKGLKLHDFSNPFQASTQYMQLPDNEHAIHLKEVNITGKNESFHGPNPCGDYVCRFNILNCPNHRWEADNRLPVKGQMYIINNRFSAYQGCDLLPDNASIKGIYFAQEFYPADYSKETSDVPDYQSTIYWKYQLKVSSLKTAELSFYTSDITGHYKIVVQGVTTSDVTYGETDFNIVKSK